MNRLGFRLSLAFVGAILLVVIALVATSFIVVRTVWEQGEFEDSSISLHDFVMSRLFNADVTGFSLPHRPLVMLARALLWIALVGGVVGIGVGISIGRRMVASLNEMVSAARAIGAHDLSRRIALQGPEEIQAVAGAFNQMAEELQSAGRQRQQLLADIAHELRTPLTVIQGNLRAILDDVYPLEKEEVARLYDQTRQLTRLVNDLRELAQADAHQLPLNVGPTDVGRFVRLAAERFEPLAEAAGVRLLVEAEAGLPPAQADGDRITQVLDNLLANALRHTPAGESIRLFAGRDGSWVVLGITDTGEGIEPDDLPHVFDRFYRADRSRNRDTGGSGLGLTIVRALVEAHGGVVSAASEGRGRGSTFRVSLPIATVDQGA